MESPLIPCPDCGYTVSSKAGACPNCGRLIRYYKITTDIKKITKAVFITIGILSLAVIIILLFTAHQLSVPSVDEKFYEAAQNEELQKLSVAEDKYKKEDGKIIWLNGQWVDTDPILTVDINYHKDQAASDGNKRDWLERQRLNERSRLCFISGCLFLVSLLAFIVSARWLTPR